MTKDPFILQVKEFERRCREGIYRYARHPTYSLVTEMVDFRGKRILDVGCGVGHFKDRLDTKGIKYRSYTGIDGSLGIVSKGLDRHGSEIDLRCITWPYPSQSEEEGLLDMEFDVAVILGVVYMFGDLGSGLPSRFVEFTSLFVNESILFDWRSKEELAADENAFDLPGFDSLIIKATGRRVWCLMRKKDD